MMVDVVTNQAAEEDRAAEVIAADDIAAKEMAEKAQEVSEEDNTAEEEAPRSEQKDWDDLLEEDEDEEEASLEIEKPEEEAPKVEETAEEVVQETPEVEIPTAEEIPEEVKPEAEEETRTPEEVNAELKQARETARDKLVESFKLSEEQMETFDDDPSSVLSSMAADLFLDLYDSISQGLRGQMPGMVQQLMAQQVAVQESEKTFFNAWPQLGKAEYRQTVDRIANAYRVQNPTTDDATAVKEIGAQAWVALRLPLEQLMAHTQDAPVAEVAPVQAIPTHVPANAGNAPQSARTPVGAVKNEFEMLADELLTDDNS